jgi:DNA-binding transcriptional ArsR family regulator
VLRIFFTGQDVARTRVAASFDPLWELVLSLQMLRGQPGDLLFRRWRGQVSAAVRRAGLGARLRLLTELVPTYGYFPDFVNPLAALRGLDHGLEAIRSTAAHVLARDLRRLSVSGRAGPALPALARGEPAALDALTATMRDYYTAAVEPHRARLDAAVEHDRAARMRAMAGGGVEGLLHSLRPGMAWSSGELTVAGHPQQEIHLDGRGLLLIPSYFCVNHPITLFDPALPPVLVYPVLRSAETLPTALLPGANTSLRALIGPTRAAVLEAAVAGGTTGELARRVGVSPATASEHASVLRAAGLVVSHRDRNRVVHQVSRLGLGILRRAVHEG